MKRILIWTICAATLLNNWVAAQNRPSISIKSGISSVFLPKYTFALEWKQRQNLSFELTGSYRVHRRTTINPYEILVKEYALRRTYNFEWGSPDKYNDSGWKYLGDGRPTENQEEPGEFHLNTSRINFGFRYSGHGISERLKYFIQPSITVARHQTIIISPLKKNVVSEAFQTWQVGESETGTHQAMHTIHYAQYQEKKLKEYWLVGPACQFGLYWNLWEGLSLEPRLNLGINIDKNHPEKAEAVNELRRLFAQLDLMICYAIGF